MDNEFIKISNKCEGEYFDILNTQNPHVKGYDLIGLFHCKKIALKTLTEVSVIRLKVIL